jgi:hypothetical protein
VGRQDLLAVPYVHASVGIAEQAGAYRAECKDAYKDKEKQIGERWQRPT